MFTSATLPRTSFANPVLAEVRMDASFDAVHDWYMTIARALYAMEAQSIPAEWSFTPGAGEVTNDGDPFDFDALSYTEARLLDFGYDVADLFFLGNVLVRYLKVLKDAGMDEVGEF